MAPNDRSRRVEGFAKDIFLMAFINFGFSVWAGENRFPRPHG
jgi:hypothetical protein